MRDSRRARIVLAVLLLISTFIVVIDLRGGADGARDTGSGVLAPLERAAATITRPIGGFFSALGAIGSNADRIAELERENSDLQTQLRTLADDQARVQQLDALLGLAGKARYRIVPAEVVARGSSQGFAFTATIDAGANDGVKVGMTVINGDGLVGRVIRASRSAAVVLLLVDPTSSVGARVAGSRQLGFLNGRGDRAMELQLLDPRAPLAQGDALVTFGSQGSPFVPGVPIGSVTGIRGTAGSLTRVAAVEPYVDIDSLGIVGVVLGRPARDPRDSLVPPSPRPTTAPPTSPATASPTSPAAAPPSTAAPTTGR
jgi:rod shape-determining protein MreC